jgi:hypothetical protein
MEENKTIILELSEDQTKKLDNWLEAIKIIHGNYGEIEYRIRESGIGKVIRVYSFITNTELDLTDFDRW